MTLRGLIEAVEAGENYAHIDFFTPLDPLTESDDLGIDGRNAYCGSLDAAKRLHDALLPGWQWLIRSTDDDDVRLGKCQQGQFLANIWGEGSPNEGAQCFPTWADNPARAWLLATLRALEGEP